MNKINIFYEHILEACAQQKEDVTIEEMLKRFRSFGIEGLECDLWRLSVRAETKALFENCGMHTASVYNMFDFPHDSREVSLKKIHDCLETAAYFGADRVLAIPGFVREGDDSDEVRGKICEELNLMCAAAREYGITVTLEDFDDKASPCSTIEGLEFFMRNVDGLGFTFDTGNFAYSLESAEEAYARLKRYVAHVHLKDRSWDNFRGNGTNGKADLSGAVMYPSEVGGGFIGIESLVRQLIRDGYTGSFSIEHFGAVNQLEYAEKSAENIRAYLAKGDIL